MGGSAAFGTNGRRHEEVETYLEYEVEDIIEECTAILYLLEDGETRVQSINEGGFIWEEFQTKIDDNVDQPQDSTLKIQDGEVVTSQNVHITFAQAITFGEIISQYQGKEVIDNHLQVSNYKGFISGKDSFTVGCHRIKWDHAMEILSKLNAL